MEHLGERAPFFYFVDHSDLKLIEVVRQGRKEEFKKFSWDKEPPDAQSKTAFLQSKINWKLREKEKHCLLLNFYRELIKFRKGIPALSNLDKDCLWVNMRKKK